MGKHIEIIPSIASADQLSIAEEIRRIGDWKKLHIDIEDGNFVPNITFGEKMTEAIARFSKQELDAHLLVNHPEQYLSMLKRCGVKKIAVHIEALQYPLAIINQIREMGMVPGLAVNFMTSPETVKMFADAAQYVIVMTAEPDNKGQEFHPPIISKIASLRKALPETTEIWADGGINEANMRQVTDAGAATLIMGRCVFKAKDPYIKLCQLSNTDS